MTYSDSRPYVSVVVPTRDRPHFAHRAVLSALAQEEVSLEVLVVDDGGRRPLALNIDDPRIRIIRNQESTGVSSARNRGLFEARAPWVAFLDDDDIWAPHKLKTQLDALRTERKRWSIASSVVVDLGGDTVSLGECPPDSQAVLDCLCVYNAVPGGGSGPVVERSLLDEVGGFDERLSMVADWEMWHRLAHTEDCAIVGEPLVGYLRHGTSMTANFADHRGEIDRMERATLRYCSSSTAARRDRYLDWIANGTASVNPKKAAVLKFRIAMERRSIHAFLMALRLLMIPTHVSVRSLFWTRSPLVKQLDDVPAWISDQHFSSEPLKRTDWIRVNP